MADFVGCATGGKCAASVAVDGSFAQRAGGDGEFNQTASLRLERPGFLGGSAERLIGAHDGRIRPAELLEARWNLLMVLWLGFGFSVHEFERNKRRFTGERLIHPHAGISDHAKIPGQKTTRVLFTFSLLGWLGVRSASLRHLLECEVELQHSI